MVSHCSHEFPKDTSRPCSNGNENLIPGIEAAPQRQVDRDFEERSVLDDDAEYASELGLCDLTFVSPTEI